MPTDQIAQALISVLKQSNGDEPYWADYAAKAQKYLNRPAFHGTPITGKMLADANLNAYNKYGRLTPLHLALAQGQFETKLGTNSSGRPNYRSNPYNVGEFDSGTKMKFGNTTEGLQAYFDLMAKDYLRKKTMWNLLDSFTNNRGNRYASDPEYETKIRGQVDYIKKFLGE